MPHHEIPLLPGCRYHLYNHANGFENLFANEGNYTFFLRKYAQHINPVADTFAYCLMPNHFHFCIRIKSEEQLSESFRLSESSPPAAAALSNKISRCFGNLFSSYTQAFNKQQNRHGSLFVSNFKRKEVDDDWYFARLIHYIHYNPVHHGFVEHPAEYVHSSFSSLLSDRPTHLQRAEVMNFFGGRDAFLEAHNLAPDDAVVKLVLDWL